MWVEEIDDPLMQKLRYLDKLVDELYYGRPMEKVLRQAPAGSANRSGESGSKAVTARS